MTEPALRGVAVVYFPGLAGRGGAERVALQIAVTLRDLGYRTLVATEPIDLRPLGDYLGVDVEGLEVLNLEPAPSSAEQGRWGRSWSRSDRTARHAAAIRRRRPDLVVDAKYKSELPALGRHSLSYVNFPHHRPGAGSGPAVRAVLRVLDWAAALRHGLLPWPDPVDAHDVVIANSAFVAGHLERRWGRTPIVLHPSSPMPTPTGVGAPRDRAILTLGRITRPEPHVPNKRHDVLIDAFAASSLGERGWTLHVAGSCGAADAAYAEELALRAAGTPVRFHPNADRSELDDLLGSVSVYWHAQGFGEDEAVHPEAVEHFGISVVEAMAAGVLPVVYAAGGPVEIVGDLGDSWHDVEELLAATDAIAAADPAVLADRRERVRRRAADFDDATFRSRLADIVRGVTGRA